MKEVVELNKLSITSFTKLEQKLLFSVLVKCREQAKGVELELKADDLMRFINQHSNTTKQNLLDIVMNLYNNFFKLHFEVIKKQGNLTCLSYYNLFSFFKIYYEKNKTHQNNNLIKIKLKVNDDCAYLLYEITNKLQTQFEIEELALKTQNELQEPSNKG
ncbi:MAG: hypothetical protein MSS71_07145 [Campylobacter sp.]|uniref:RepB family plasmid replication initiator protein n=1 Tax=Campylobacter sp. TaxID=205 RepID=UPI002AA813FE|nr:RepB family plasmid replication initiator protein [Campylobacter sp.]MCI7587610.1 hypothetical protein [Campylobacter sp.]